VTVYHQLEQKALWPHGQNGQLRIEQVWYPALAGDIMLCYKARHFTLNNGKKESEVSHALLHFKSFSPPCPHMRALNCKPVHTIPLSCLSSLLYLLPFPQYLQPPLVQYQTGCLERNCQGAKMQHPYR